MAAIKKKKGVPVVARWLTNPTRNHESGPRNGKKTKKKKKKEKEKKFWSLVYLLWKTIQALYSFFNLVVFLLSFKRSLYILDINSL